MREHDQPRRRSWNAAWLALLLGLAWPGGLRGSDGPDASADPIELAGREVRTWQADGASWVVLLGDAAVSQGHQGLRGRAAVVRISESDDRGTTVRTVEVYAEGDPGDGSGRVAGQPSRRAAFRSRMPVRLTSPDRSGLTRLDGPPSSLEILRRSGMLGPVPAGEARPPVDRELVESQATVPRLGPGEGSPAPPGTSRAGGLAQAPARPAAPAGPPPVERPEAAPPEIDLPPIEGAPEVEVPRLDGPEPDDGPPRAAPLPEPGPGPSQAGPTPPVARPGPPRGRTPAAPPNTPVLSGSRRVTSIFPRSGRPVDVQILPKAADGTQIVIYRGGVNIVSSTPQIGLVDIESDSAVIWRHPKPDGAGPVKGPNGEVIDDADQPMEVYLEGNVVVRQDEQKYAGKADQRTYRAARAFYDFLTDRLLAMQGEVDLFGPGLITPMKIKSPRLEQFRPLARRPDGTLFLDPNPEIRAEQTFSTGSRFPNPAYSIYNRSIDLTRSTRPAVEPNSGRQVGAPGDPDPPEDQVWRYDARRNFFYMGWLPVFFWPRFTGEIDDLEPPLRQISFRTNNYFGQQVLTDWNGFKVFGIRRPDWIDQWNLDLDYLSYRTKEFPALGSEMGWFGRDLIGDLSDPYRRARGRSQSLTHDYFGYFDTWGLRDSGIDVLGSGPAIVTNGPPGAGKKGYQRDGVPPFQDFRGRFNIRHMQRFLPDDDEHRFEDIRLQLEAAYSSDRYFIEEYYKRLNEAGMDQETVGYLVWQKDNWAANLWAEANLQDFYTDTQWLPRLDYYRLGDSLLNRWVNYNQHSGVNYASTHTDIAVNNPNIFAFQPYDPISHTAGTFEALRAYTNHEVTVPLNIADVIRIVPYGQGQIVGWSEQLGGGPLGLSPTGASGRYWGALGAHAEVTAWKIYPGVESEILNVHGLNNKVSFYADYRSAWSNQSLDDIAVQDDLDDNTNEAVRRYFALTNYTGGILPGPYDPRHLILRRGLSPITGTTDIQSTISTAQLGIHQRLQTKRGPEGRRRIVDWMTLDLNGTYFPNADRDNFGTPWGQTQYNWQWFVGDRTSIVSSGWFEFFDLVGSKPLSNYNVRGDNPKGVNVITTGISLNRPPRANLFLGYAVIDTGTIQTSALNTSLSYWLSPKWYGTYSTSYDFGNRILLGSMFSLTRIGADYLVSVGLSVDPQRQSYMFAFQISPRLSPNLRLGAGTGLNSFDSRYAATQ